MLLIALQGTRTAPRNAFQSASEGQSPTPVHKRRISRTHIHRGKHCAASNARRADRAPSTGYCRIRPGGAESSEAARVVDGEVRRHIGRRSGSREIRIIGLRIHTGRSAGVFIHQHRNASALPTVGQSVKAEVLHVAGAAETGIAAIEAASALILEN